MMELLLVPITQTSHDWCPGIHHQLWLAPQDPSQPTISHDWSITQLSHPPLLLTTTRDYHPWTTATLPHPSSVIICPPLTPTHLHSSPPKLQLTVSIFQLYMFFPNKQYTFTCILLQYILLQLLQLTHSWRRSLLYRNQSIDLLYKPMNCVSVWKGTTPS